MLEDQTIDGLVSENDMADERHRWTDEEVEILGTIPDSEVARILGIEESAVKSKRGTERIRLKRKPRNQGEPDIMQDETKKPGRKAREWTEEELALLGMMADTDVAKALNLSPPTVMKKRKELEIEPFDWRSANAGVEHEEAEAEEEDEPEEADEPEEPRKPSGANEMVGIEEELANKARIVAVQRGVSLSAYLSSVIRPGIDQDYRKTMIELSQEYDPKKPK